MLRIVLHGQIPEDLQRQYETALDHKLPQESNALPPVRVSFSDSEAELLRLMNKQPTHMFVTIGPQPAPMAMLPLHDRRRWAHFDAPPSPADLLRVVHETYLSYALFPSAIEAKEPLLSVYTPTYNPGPFLIEAYNSLKSQTYGNWEWVIVDDGSSDGTRRTLRELSERDNRVKVHFPQRSGQANIGLIKRTCTGLCLGEIVVELDHDDLFTSDCLAEVAAAFVADPDLGMVHSNFAEFKPDGSAHTYPEWVDRGRYRTTIYQGHEYAEALAYDVYGDIYGAGPVIQHMAVCPNHVRAFRASELWRVGGYNPSLTLADDYDLMIRMFTGSKIGHITKMLYLYRIHDNTWSRFNDFARWMFNVVENRWRGDIQRRVAELKAQGLWNPEPQGVLPDSHPALARAAEGNRARGIDYP